MRIAHALLCVLLLAGPAAVAAQETAATKGTAGKRLPAPMADAEQRKADARTMADAIVAAFDDGDIRAQWALAGPALRGMADERLFVDTIGGLRRQTGGMRSRRPQGVVISTDLPDTPPGTYATIFFTTDFTTVGEVEEKVVLEDVGGRWRLAGYYVKKAPAAD